MRRATIFLYALLITSAAAAGDVGSLLKDLASEDVEVRTAAAKELSQEKELPEDAVRPVVGYIRACLDAAEQTTREPAPKIEGPIERVPLVGDETPLVRVKSSPQDYLGKDIIITCTAKVSDYYNFEYSDLGTALSSLRCNPVDEQRKEKDEYCHVYVDRKTFRIFIDAVAACEERDSPIVCRLKLTINPRRRLDVLADSWNMFELREWQFMNSDKKTWTDWQPRKAPKLNGHFKQLLARLPESAAPAMAEFCVTDTSDGASLALYSRLLEMPKPARKSAADHVRKLGYKSKDAAFKKKAPAFAKSLESGKPLQ